MKKQSNRSERGANLAEGAAVAVIGIPLLTVIIFLGLECARFFTIKSAMDVASRNAARALVVDYNKTSSKGTAVTWISIPHYVASSKQFSVDWDTATPPTFVTVTCAYPSNGLYGLPKFPGGPLGFISSSFNLNNTSVKGSFTVPVQ
jgi:hypothetical protein